MADEVLNIIDATRDLPDEKEKAVIHTYALTTHVTMALPLETHSTGMSKWTIEDDLQYNTGNYRKFNNEFESKKTNTKSFAVNVAVSGGKVAADRALVKINPGEVRREQLNTVRSFAHGFTADFFQGADVDGFLSIDGYIDNEDFWNSQQLNCGASADSPAVISPDKIDAMIALHNVTSRTFLYVSGNVYLKIKKDSRGNESGGYNVNYLPREFGTFAGYYDDIPIIIARDGKGTDYFAKSGSGTNSVSAYLVTYGEENMVGIQQGPPDVINLETGVLKTFEYEHMLAPKPYSRKCITRLNFIKDAIA